MARSKFKQGQFEKTRSQKKKANARYYKLNSILGNTWAMFFGIIGGRKTGKSYSVADFICKKHNELGSDNLKVYWMRISETSTKAMLANKADKLIDPDLKRKYNLELTTKAMDVYNHGEPFCTVVPLSQFGKLKGVGFYDKDFEGEYILVLDEFQLEQGERRTTFNILYNFIGMCENIARTTKSKIRVFLLGNTLEEASTILKAFNFLPEKFGRFYLHSKRCVIDNLEPTEEYLKDREGSIADILGGDSMSNYTNQLNKDRTRIDNRRLIRPTGIIKFSKDAGSWYTIWDEKIIRKYNREQLDESRIWNMRPHIGYYSTERRKIIVDLYDQNVLKFNNLITQSYFAEELNLIRAVR